MFIRYVRLHLMNKHVYIGMLKDFVNLNVKFEM